MTVTSTLDGTNSRCPNIQTFCICSPRRIAKFQDGSSRIPADLRYRRWSGDDRWRSAVSREHCAVEDGESTCCRRFLDIDREETHLNQVDRAMNRFLHMRGLALSLSCLVALGCGRMASSPRSAPVTITVDRMYEQADLVVVLAHLVFPGERQVHLWQETDSETSRAEPDPKTGMSECDVVLVADVIQAGDASRARWLHSIRSSTGMAGGPANDTLPLDAKLTDLLQIQLQSGEYQFGQEIDVAVFRDQPLRLRID